MVLRVRVAEGIIGGAGNAGDAGECNAAASTLNGLWLHLRPTFRLGLSSDTILDGLPIVAPINAVTALIYRLVLLLVKVSLQPLSEASPGMC